MVKMQLVNRKQLNYNNKCNKYNQIILNNNNKQNINNNKINK